MSLGHNRAWLVLGLLLASDVWALGLGDIRLSSALNEPLRAEIQLLSATAEELSNLKVQLAPPATFERYGIDRPFYLTRLQFSVVRAGQGGAGIVRITSADPITEPFITFLVEATWSSGRLLREYTVLLDPPTFAPPPSSPSSQAVTAPGRASQADSGRIERPAAAPQPAPDDAGTAGTPGSDSFDTAAPGDVYVQRGDTLWEIASRVRPDSRLNMNQMMVAIYEANPQAFDGNINRLNAGATLRIPSADDIFSISRGDAMSQVQQQNAAWGGGAEATGTEPSLTLVPPDGDQADYEGAASRPGADGTAGAATAERIRELEDTIAEQNSLIEIRDNELAQLRDELARLRAEGAVAADTEAVPSEEAPATDATVDETDDAAADDTDELFVDDDDIAAEDDAVAEDEAEPAPAATTPERTSPQIAASRDEPGIVDRIIALLTGFWGILGVVLLLVLAILVWLAKRAAGRGEDESTGVWEALDSDDDIDSESRASTERLRALARDDDSSIVVIEQETDRRRSRRDPAATGDFHFDEDALSLTSAQPTLEDTFSSETAINLDQSDPVAEADFHMAYGLYDQAADLINSALAVEPERQDLMAKLCEIYFVWGNQDAFVAAATRLHDQLGGEATPDWDKIVIMGQQIAGDHKLFSGASAAGAATRIVDLSLDDGVGALDMDFAGGPDGEVSDVIDLGGEEESGASDDGLDFMFDDEPERDTGATTTREMPNRKASDESTVETPTIESRLHDRTVESPTIEQPIEDGDGTSELPSISESDEDAARWAGDATAEIDLDDLGLDLDALAKAGLGADLDDEDEEAANTDFSHFEDTGENRALQAELDSDDTGRNTSLDDDNETSTGRHERFDIEAAFEDGLGATSEMPVLDEETGKNPALRDLDEMGSTDLDVDIDTSLLDATGQTQILSGDFSVRSRKRSLRDDEKTLLSPAYDDDAETLLASVDDLGDEGYEATTALSGKDIDFDFAKTEALPKDAFKRGASADETGELPVGGMDVDLDLDDLTSALRFSEGDTVDQPRDDGTVEQRMPKGRGRGHDFIDLDVGDPDDIEDDAPTEALSPDELSDDLHDARTMTEVGTKLDLARAYVDMGDPDGARSILEEVLDEGDEGQRQQAQKLIDSLPA
ncbi:MAG: FimV/HubP family polar landmark protein [Woeseia sp.]